LKIFGEKYDTDKLQLRTANNTSNKFERGRIDSFTYEFNDLGKVCYFFHFYSNHLMIIYRLNIYLLDIMEKILEQDGFLIG